MTDLLPHNLIPYENLRHLLLSVCIYITTTWQHCGYIKHFLKRFAYIYFFLLPRYQNKCLRVYHTHTHKHTYMQLWCMRARQCPRGLFSQPQTQTEHRGASQPTYVPTYLCSLEYTNEFNVLGAKVAKKISISVKNNNIKNK